MQETPARRSRSFRFSLATLLLFSLCIGGSIAGYQAGFRSGLQAGNKTRYELSMVQEPHSYAQFMLPIVTEAENRETATKLHELIRSTISPEVWDSPGYEIRDFPTNQSLVISARGSVQNEIRSLFKQLGRGANRNRAAKL